MFRKMIADPHYTLRVFGFGMLLFFIGLGTLLHAKHNIEPSLEQELFTLAALLIGGSGFLVVIAAHVCLIINRLRNLG